MWMILPSRNEKTKVERAVTSIPSLPRWVDDVGHNDRVAHRHITIRLDPARLEDLVVLVIEAQGLLDSAVETREPSFGGGPVQLQLWAVQAAQFIDVAPTVRVECLPDHPHVLLRHRLCLQAHRVDGFVAR